ncbi:MAG: efflux RND transporter periplasmic adaptor subunit [Flavobacterium sp.]
MKVKKLLLFIFIFALLGLVIYRITENASKTMAGPVNGGAKSSMIVNGIVLEPQRFSNQINLTGTIEANEMIDLRSEVSGVVQQINFQEGSQVQKGQLLIKINDIDLRAQLSQAQTRANLSAENERRARLLLQKEAISQEELDIAAAEHQSNLAQIDLVKAQIAKTAIVAPFSGKIGLRYISPGAFVTSTTPIAKLVNNQNVKITFAIPEKYASAMKPNAEIQFQISGSKELFNAKIYAVEPEVDAATRTLTVRALAANKEEKLFPGTFANVIVPLQDIDEALLIPNEAIIPIQNGKKVFITENGKAKEVIIETSTRTDKEILVLSGLKKGDTLITSGIMALRNGAPLTVKLTKS